MKMEHNSNNDSKNSARVRAYTWPSAGELEQLVSVCISSEKLKGAIDLESSLALLSTHTRPVLHE